jgi:hypothetical protein
MASINVASGLAAALFALSMSFLDLAHPALDVVNERGL